MENDEQGRRSRQVVRVNDPVNGGYVAIGQFDSEADEFAAEKLLGKCPSKYQALEEKS